MKKIASGVVVAVMLLSAGLALAKDQTFTGEIMDSQCAMNGSHDMMLKKEGMGDKNAKDPMVKKMCTDECVKSGGKYVLFNSTRKVTYMLDDQQKPAEFAGQNVKVTGTYDNATKTIHVTGIRKAS